MLTLLKCSNHEQKPRLQCSGCHYSTKSLQRKYAKSHIFNLQGAQRITLIWFGEQQNQYTALPFFAENACLHYSKMTEIYEKAKKHPIELRGNCRVLWWCSVISSLWFQPFTLVFSLFVTWNDLLEIIYPALLYVIYQELVLEHFWCGCRKVTRMFTWSNFAAWSSGFYDVLEVKHGCFCWRSFFSRTWIESRKETGEWHRSCFQV